MEKNVLIKMINDYSKNKLQKYSADEANEIIRQNLVEMNGGSTVLDVKAFRRNPMLFDVVEEVVRVARDTGLKENDFFNAYVEEVPVAEMDAHRWILKKDCNLIVSDIARGTQSIRRQRLYSGQKLTLTPVPHAIDVYEEWTRLMSGKVDLSEMMDAMSSAIIDAKLDDIYSIWNTIASANVGADCYYGGSYDEESVLGVVQKVQAHNPSASVSLVTTLSGARKLTSGVVSNSDKEDYRNFGHVMKWNGIPLMAVPQRFDLGTTNFKLDDTKIYVVSTVTGTPIKGVNGDPYFKIGDPADKADLTTDLITIDQWQYGLLMATGSMGLVDLT